MMALVVLALASVGLAQAPNLAAAVDAAEAKARDGQVQSAVDDLRALLGGVPTSDRARARALSVLGALETRIGDYAAAVGHAVAAAAWYDAAGDGGRAADARNTAGLAELYAARYDAALGYLEPALRGSAAAADWAGHAEQLTNLGNVYYFLGRYDDAGRTYDRAATLVETYAAAPWAARRRRFVQANQAVLHQRLGRYRAALQLYQAMTGPAGPLRPEEHAQMLVNQGALYRRLGDPYKALDAYAAARAVFADRAHREGELGTLTNRGIVLALDLRRPDEAVAAFDEALAAASRTGSQRERVLATLYRGEAAVRAGRLTVAATDFAAARTAAETLQLSEEIWKAWYGLGRVRAAAGDVAAARDAYTQAIVAIDALREALDVPASRADFFQDKREVYDARIALGLAAGDAPAVVFDLLERGRARAWRERLGLPGSPDLGAIQAALPPATTVLSYWHSPAGVAVIRLTRESVVMRSLQLPPPLLTRLGAALAAPGSAELGPLTTAVAAALIPEDLLRDTTDLVVVPDGPIGLVPFETLPLDGAPVVARMSVRYVPAAAALLRRQSGSGWLAPWSTTLAAFGDPLPGADASAASPRLAASAVEIAHVDATLGGRHFIFTGAANRKDRLTAALARRPPVLHLATHGVADADLAERSRLLFSPGNAGVAADALYLREIYDLPFDGVMLAVLSACETERGPVVRGEGVQGFGRALLAAGAGSAVTTLWRVPDRSAARLMAAFYRQLQAGVGRADALAMAKRTLMADPAYADPHHWAAFILTGDDGPLPRAPRWRTLVGVALLAGGACLLLAAGWRRRAGRGR